MSTTPQHTPGPWRWTAGGVDVDPLTYDAPGYYNNLELKGPDDVDIVSAGGGEYNPLKGESCDIRAANGRLIAAAPELLRAVELWIKFFDTMPKGQFGKIVCDIGLMNEAFLASASGLRTAGRT